MTVVGYAFDEGWTSVRRAGKSAVISIGTIAIAFVTLGGFLLISVNVQRALDRWLEAAELSVYLQDAITDDARAALESYLASQPAVLAVEFMSKSHALERFQNDFPELADVTASLSDNPFPAALEVRLQTGQFATDMADELARTVAEREGVADVRYDRRWLARLLAIVTGARVAGAIAAAVLMLGAAFTVASVVRQSLHARRDELEIMQLVGPPFSYIRGPSIVEGLLLGGIGAAVALAAIALVFTMAGRSLEADLAGLTGGAQLRFLGVRESAILLFGGLAVGAGAGALASRAVK
ncbi:MAG: permease-like cell division protein FtsX [Acidobacteriota bacterium]|nr:permease-like cell division protein FtsX [Acidobacteriota bacterium]